MRAKLNLGILFMLQLHQILSVSDGITKGSISSIRRKNLKDATLIGKNPKQEGDQGGGHLDYKIFPEESIGLLKMARAHGSLVLVCPWRSREEML